MLYLASTYCLLFIHILRFWNFLQSYNSHPRPELLAASVNQFYFSISHLGLIQYNEYVLLMPSNWCRISHGLASEIQNVCDIVVSGSLLTGN